MPFNMPLKFPEATTINDKILMSFKILNIFFYYHQPAQRTLLRDARTSALLHCFKHIVTQTPLVLPFK